MDLGLTGKVVIVTGAASGIGAAVARILWAEGAVPFLTDRDGAALARVADEMGVSYLVAELAEVAASAGIVEACLARHGKVDGLVNAAALTTRGSFLSGSVAVWDQLFDVNARAGFLLMQAVIGSLLGRQAAGSIVNILSMNAHCGTPELAIYAATKGAMATLTRNAANAHMADRIRVNGINLGWVATEAEHRMQSEILGRGPDWQSDVAARLPLKRFVTAQETARLVAFLLGDASIPMSGSVVDFEQKVLGAP